MKRVVASYLVLNEEDVVKIIAKEFNVSKESISVMIHTRRDEWGNLQDPLEIIINTKNKD